MAKRLGFRPVGRIILGSEYSGFQLKYFEAGTTTLKTTFTDSGLTLGNENTNPVVLDSRGTAQVWFGGNAKVQFLDTADVVIYTDDDINPLLATDAAGDFNLALNGSFEDDIDNDGIPDDWDRVVHAGGTVARDTTAADTQHGAATMKFNSTGSGGGFITSSNFMPVSKHRAISLSFLLKSSVADVRNVVEVLWFKEDNTASSTPSTTMYDDSTTNPTSWTLSSSLAVFPPSDARFAKLRMTGCHDSDATSGTTWYDDVMMSDAPASIDESSILATQVFS